MVRVMLLLMKGCVTDPYLLLLCRYVLMLDIMTLVFVPETPTGERLVLVVSERLIYSVCSAYLPSVESQGRSQVVGLSS